jgi:hypothetical protein
MYDIVDEFSFFWLSAVTVFFSDVTPRGIMVDMMILVTPEIYAREKGGVFSDMKLCYPVNISATW